MAKHFYQSDRMGRLSTVLGVDVLVIQRFNGTDHVNALFDYQIDCLAARSDLDFDALLGTHATITLVAHDGSEWPYDGIVTEARWLGAGDSGHRYRLRLQPWFFMASLRRNQRIFHEKTVIDILTELLGAYADLGPLRVAVSADYPVLEYTVQYRESDMAFAMRMMERHGISYHFQHMTGAHEMVLTDIVGSHPSIGPVPFRPDEGKYHDDTDHFWDWRLARRVTTGAIRLTDYNFKEPTAMMETDHVGDSAYARGQTESFDWPGDYLDEGRGAVVAHLRSDSERGNDRRYQATGDIMRLVAGTRVDLTGDEVPGTGEKYLCLSATHSYTSDNYGSGGSENDGMAYTGHYVLMPVTAPMLPPIKTPRSAVLGPQTAVVVGEGEIDCDEFGRILVQFHWDLAAAFSMRCRVSQTSAGNGWGGVSIPRIGMEVVVEFLEGDPDKPLVTGTVFNGKNKLPYDLPANKTRTTLRTDTFEGTGYNELRFEDKAGEEEVFIHAQKDMNLEVLNDRSKRVGTDQSEKIGNDKSIEVGGDHDEVISGNMSIAVGQNPLSALLMGKTKLLFDAAGTALSKLKIPDPFNFAKGNFQIYVEKNKSEVVGVGSSEVVGAAKSIVVGHTFQTTVGKSHSVIVRGRYDTDVGKVMNVRVGDQLTIKVGENSTLTMSKEGDILIEGKSIVFKADKITQN